MAVSSVFQVVASFGFGELVEYFRAEFPELVDGTRGSIAEQFFQLRKGQLNRIQIGEHGGK